MTQIFVASTLFGAMTVAAAIDAGRFGPPGRRRMLLVSDNTAIPELGRDLTLSPGFAGLRDRFDEVRSWNAEISPLHPSGWTPRPEDLPLWERLFRGRWGLDGEPLELAVETIAASPARALASIFSEAPITVYSDGLMSYGPTRDGLPDGVGSRITRLLHLDLVQGLAPLLLNEHGVPCELVPDDAFTAVLHKLKPPEPPADGLEGGALLVGQYLAALEILSEREEDELHVAMLRGVVARGHTTVLFKPHPSSPVRTAGTIAREAARLGVRLVVLDAAVPAEAWCAALRPSLIVGCFSTALVTASRYHGVPAAAVGTGLLLQRLAPYQNGNRVPVTIIDATVPRLAEDGSLCAPPLTSVSDLHALLVAVAYAMRAALLPERRGEAAAFLAEHGSGEMARYFKKRRLTALGLPGGLPPGRRALLSTALPPRSRRRRIAARAVEAAGLDRDP